MPGASFLQQVSERPAVRPSSLRANGAPPKMIEHFPFILLVEACQTFFSNLRIIVAIRWAPLFSFALVYRFDLSFWGHAACRKSIPG
jgi:hypothetical protein